MLLLLWYNVAFYHDVANSLMNDSCLHHVLFTACNCSAFICTENVVILTTCQRTCGMIIVCLRTVMLKEYAITMPGDAVSSLRRLFYVVRIQDIQSKNKHFCLQR